MISPVRYQPIHFESAGKSSRNSPPLQNTRFAGEDTPPPEAPRQSLKSKLWGGVTYPFRKAGSAIAFPFQKVGSFIANRSKNKEAAEPVEEVKRYTPNDLYTEDMLEIPMNDGISVTVSSESEWFKTLRVPDMNGIVVLAYAENKDMSRSAILTHYSPDRMEECKLKLDQLLAENPLFKEPSKTYITIMTPAIYANNADVSEANTNFLVPEADIEEAVSKLQEHLSTQLGFRNILKSDSLQDKLLLGDLYIELGKEVGLVQKQAVFDPATIEKMGETFLKNTQNELVMYLLMASRPTNNLRLEGLFAQITNDLGLRYEKSLSEKDAIGNAFAQTANKLGLSIDMSGDTLKIFNNNQRFEVLNYMPSYKVKRKTLPFEVKLSSGFWGANYSTVYGQFNQTEKFEVLSDMGIPVVADEPSSEESETETPTTAETTSEEAQPENKE